MMQSRSSVDEWLCEQDGSDGIAGSVPECCHLLHVENQLEAFRP